AQKNNNRGGRPKQNRRFEWKCYNCGKKGHIAKNCWSKKKTAESNAATSRDERKSDDEWDVEASFAVEEELVLTAMVPEQIDYDNNWIVDTGCSNHMTNDKEKLHNMTEYKGGREVVTANNSRLPIAHIGKMVFVP
ncbi:Zinc finger, CCHC-type, partial [Parasponia andersonii]